MMNNKILIKYLTYGLKKKSGHNNFGRITVFNLGGGHKRKYRIIDFKRNLVNNLGAVVDIVKDPNRSANIALIVYSNGGLSYILAPEGLSIGDKILSSNENILQNDGNSTLLKYMKMGTIIHNVELKPGKGGQIARAAGTCSIILRKYNLKYFVLKLPSGIEYLINKNCRASFGVLSNYKNKLIKKKKAGNSR